MKFKPKQSKIFSFFIVFLFLFTLFSFIFVDNVEATAYYYSYGMENSVVTSQVTLSDIGNVFLTTKKMSHTNTFFYVTNAMSHNGTKSFEMLSDVASMHNAFGYFNFSVGSNLMTTWSAYISLLPAGFALQPYSVYFYFYNSQYQATYTTDSAIVIYYNVLHPNATLGNHWYYLDLSGNPHEIGYAKNTNFYYLSWQITGIDTVSYIFDHNITVGEPRHIVNNNYTYINTNYVDTITGTPAGSQCGLFIDDVTVGFDTGYILEPCGSTTGLNHQGKIDSIYPLWFFTSSQSLEITRNVPFKDVWISVLDLLIKKDWFDTASDLSKYSLSINSANLGHPSCVVEYEGNYLLRWCGFSMHILNDNIQLIFTSSTLQSSLYPSDYWVVGITPGGTDSDNDGDSLFLYTSEYQTHIEYPVDWWNPFSWFQPTGTVAAYQYINYGSDLLYRVYYTGDDSISYSTYTDSILIEDKNINLTTENNLAKIHFTASSLLDISYMRIEKMGAYLINQSMTSATDSLYYIIDSTGTYNVTLYRNGIKATDSFIATGIIPEDYIYTYPYKTLPSESFSVFFGYNHTQPCRIRAYRNAEIQNTWTYNIVPVETSFVYSNSVEGIYYFRLYGYYFNNDTGSQELTQIKECKHIIANTYDNVLGINKETITDPNLDAQVFFGSHNFLGDNVYIKINNADYLFVGDASTITEVYIPKYNGEYKCYLILKDNSGNEMILDNKTFYVTGIPVITDTTGFDVISIIKSLPVFIKVILAIIIIVVMTLLPMLVSVAIAKVGMDINIPALVYVAFFFVGMIASILLGFLEPWVIAVVLIGIILTFAILWLQGSQGN